MKYPRIIPRDLPVYSLVPWLISKQIAFCEALGGQSLTVRDYARLESAIHRLLTECYLHTLEDRARLASKKKRKARK